MLINSWMEIEFIQCGWENVSSEKDIINHTYQLNETWGVILVIPHETSGY